MTVTVKEARAASGPQGLAALVGGLLGLVSSRRTALVLMGLLLGALAIQAVVPQQGWVSPLQMALWRARYPLIGQIAGALQLDRIASTPWFWGLGLTLGLSLLLSAIRRAAALAHGAQSPRHGLRLDTVWPPSSSEEAAAVLRRRGYKVTVDGEALAATKGLLGRWGSVAFHGGMALLVLGILVSAATRFTGFVELAPGEAFREAGGYLAKRSGPLSAEDTGLFIVVQDVAVSFWPDGSVRDTQASLTAWKGDGPERERTVQRNEAFSFGGSTVFLGSRFGPATLFLFTPTNGGAPDRGYVHFPVDANGVTNRFDVPGAGGLVAEAQMEGDWRAALANVAAAQPVSMRLVFWQGGNPIHEVQLAPGQETALAAGKLTFVGVEPWALFMVGRDRGFWLLIAAGTLALAGLAMGLFVAPRWVRLDPMPDGWRATGTTTWGLASFRREMEKLGREIPGGRRA